MQTLFNFLEETADSLFRSIRKANSRIFYWCLIAYVVMAAHIYFPALYSLYTFENFTILIIIQTVVFFMDLRSFATRFLREYFRYLSLYFEHMLIGLLAVIVFGLVFLTGEDTGLLLRLAALCFVFMVYLSIYHVHKPFDFFRSSSISNKNTLIAITGVPVVITAYSYRFIFNGLPLSFSVTLSVFAGFSFALAILIMGTDARYFLRAAYFELGHAERKKITLKLRTWMVALSLLVIAGGAFGWHEWQATQEAERARTLVQNAPKSTPEEWPLRVSISDETTLSGGKRASEQSIEGLIASENKVNIPRAETAIAKTVPAKKKTVGDIYASKRYIGLGDTGDDVAWIQNFLKRSGYYQGTITKTFDAPTADALNRFMQAKTGTRKSYTQLGPKALSVFLAIPVE